MNGVPAATENEKALVSSSNQETLSLNSYTASLGYSHETWYAHFGIMRTFYIGVPRRFPQPSKAAGRNPGQHGSGPGR